MDEVRRLENQLRELQMELERQKAEAASMRTRLANENLQRLQTYENQMRSSLDQHDQATQREYERLLREYESSVNGDIMEQQLHSDLEYMRLLKSMEQKEKEWREKTQQLEQLINELKSNTQNKDQISAQEAERYLTEAALQYKSVDKKPHEKFFPNRIKTYYNAIREARTLYVGGLNEAAIAISISAKSGLNRLGFDIDEQFDEWKSQFQIFKSKTGLIHLKLVNEIANWCAFANGVEKAYKDLSDKEKDEALKNLNFWTDGKYGEISNRVATFGKEIGSAQKTGLPEYIKDEHSISLDDLKKDIAELDSMDAELEKAFALYKEKYTASCQRSDWGEMIIDFLTDEINLVWIEEESHFKAVSEENKDKPEYEKYMELFFGADYEKVDIREWLELVFTNSSNTKIFIYIVPYEKNNHVENRLVVYIDYEGAVNEEYSREIYSHICESIHVEEDESTISFATDVAQLKTNTNATLRAAGKSIETKLRKLN